MPQVSVIIPTYNRAPLLGRAINSVRAQTFQDFEIIIVDDASTDGTDALVASFNDKRITYQRHEKNQGCTATRNTALRQAQGAFIAFLDSDDEWLPEKLEKQLTLFNHASPKVGVITAGAVDIRDHTTYDQYIPKYRGDLAQKILIDNWVGLTSVPLVKKECFDKAGLFDETLRSSDDWDLWIRITQHYEVEFTPEILVRYYPQPDSIIQDHGAGIEAHKMIFKKYHHLFKAIPRTYRAARYFHEGFFFWWKRKLWDCCKSFLHAVCLNPALALPLLSYGAKKIHQKISGKTYPINLLSEDTWQ